MSRWIQDLRQEFMPMLRLAAPLAIAELGWMTMGIVDTIMAGALGPAAVGAGALGGVIYYTVVTGAVGVLMGMDTLVAQSFGARNPNDCRHTLINGVWLALLLTPIPALLILGIIPLLRVTGTNPEVMAPCAPFMIALLWGIPPLLLFTALRRYLQAVDIVKPVTFALISANIVNFVGNWVLMYGHWGMKARGLEGSGFSTSISRAYMMLVMLAAVIWHERRNGNVIYYLSWSPDFRRIRTLVALGLPAAGQIAFEGAVWALLSAVAAHLDEFSMAAHSITTQVIATAYMVPLGISSAAAVRVGQAAGRKDRDGMARAGWTALLLSALFMGTAGLVMWIAPRALMWRFIPNAKVMAAGVVLLRIAAFFELFDGFQVVATGALRGLGDTRSPMFVHFAGYWLVGLPVGYWLCFHQRWGAAGIWVGLSLALILIGGALVAVWRRRLQDW